MHDIGWSSDAFGAKLIPGGDIILHASLFLKKTKSVSAKSKSKIKPYFGTLTQKIIIFLIFAVLNFAYFYFTNAVTEVQITNQTELMTKTAFIILQYFFLPYLYSYYFRIIFNNWHAMRK